MKKIVLAMIILGFYLPNFGQQNIGFNVYAGFSKISNSLESTQIYFVPSGQIGLFYKLNLSEKTILGTELLFDHVKGKDRSKVILTDQDGNTTGETSMLYMYRNVSYIGLPIYYGIKIRKLTIKIGLQTSFTIFSSGKSEGDFLINGSVFKYEEKYNNLNVDIFNYGVIGGLSCDLTKKITLEGRYYYGINNILNNNITSDWKWKVQQLTIGLHYTFYTREKK